MKMDPRLNNILNWKNGKKMPPVTLELFPTFYCNQNCIFCPRNDLEKEETKTKLTDKQLLGIIERASDLGVRKIDLIGGGEPFRRKICIELIKKIKERGMEGYLNTNFSLPNEKDLEILAKFGWDYIKISLHAPNKSHDKITGNKGAFNSIIKNIKLLNDYKKNLGSDKPILEFGPVLFNGNYKYIKKFIILASKLDVGNLFFQPVIQYKDINNYKLSEKQNSFLVKRLKEYEILAQKLNVNINLRSLLENELIEKSNKREIENKNDVYCYEPWLHMTIWPNGTYSTCSFPHISNRGTLGIINDKNDSLKDVWYGDYFDKIRKDIKKGNVPEHCKRCVANVVLGNKKLKEQIKNE
jgi:MoaA/NifB/PqqE/SkfB family radical SAM enzyme